MQNTELLVEPRLASSPSLIKVIGVGGGGGNAVGQMYREGIDGVRFIVTNTDGKALEDSVVPTHLQLGPGLGAGGKPEVGRMYAEESLDKINEIFDKDVKMVFITAGMGGGTGTGASPVIAREARRHGILAVGVVTIPFLFEREAQIDKALDGLDSLAKEVDALLVINNQRLCEIYPHLSLIDAFKKADETLTNAVRSIVEIITMHGKVGLDFRDVNNVLKDGGVAVMSSGYAKGEGRLTKAIEDALYSPLLNNNDIYRSRKLILSITSSSHPEHTLRMEEMGEIHNFTAKFRSDIETKWGLTFRDDTEEGDDTIKVTILASGFKLYSKNNGEVLDNNHQEVEDDESKAIRRINNYPELGKKNGKRVMPRRRPKIHLYDLDDLENEELIDLIEGIPTAERTAEQLGRIVAIASARKTIMMDTLNGEQKMRPEETLIDFSNN